MAKLPNQETKAADTSDCLTFLKKSFATEQYCLKANLFSSRRIMHPGDKGEVNEEHFIDFLRRYLPNRYTVDKAMVLDSRGSVSDSIDVVIYDRQYTPTLLDNDKHRYVPAESVYAVFECKPTINKGYLEYAAQKAASVRKLYRTSVPIVTANGILPPKEPHHILAGILAIDADWSDGLGQHFQASHSSLSGMNILDCGFAASGYSFDVFENSESYTFGPKKNALAFFAFRLLGRLQSIATVPAVDWGAYATAISINEEVGNV